MAILTPIGVSSFNTRTGPVTLTGLDVTTALGYTPYNSSNPAGYITSAGAPVQSVSNSDGTLTIGPTTGAVIASLNLANSNTWSVIQSFASGINGGSGSGGNLLLSSTSNATKGKIQFGTLSYYDEANQRLILGGSTSGQGNIQFTTNPSTLFDTNLLYTNSTADTMGMLCGSTPSFAAANGPYFVFRGNTYSVITGQRGSVFIGAGTVTSPATGEGVMAFGGGSGNNGITISYTGCVGIGTAYNTVITASRLLVAAGTAAIAQINLTAGVAKTTSADGDIWYESATHVLKMNQNGTVKTFTLI